MKSNTRSTMMSCTTSSTRNSTRSITKSSTKRIRAGFFTLPLLIACILTLAACGTGASADTQGGRSTATTETTANTTITESSVSETAAETATTASVGEVTLTISAAASLTEAFEDVQNEWRAVHPEIKLVMNFGASGALQKQIEEGASVDLFISAAAKQMDALSEGGLIVEETRVDLLENTLVLVIPAGTVGIATFEDLATEKAGQVALGEPGSVPAGQYAEEVLTAVGILERVKAKAVYGKDVKSVLAWVESGDADAGIVYRTDALGSDKVDVVAEAAADTHRKIIYPAAVIKDSGKADTAAEFLEWLASGAVKEAFTDRGFAFVGN